MMNLWGSFQRLFPKTVEGGIALSYIDLLILSIGLSMDAFAVAICKGLAMKKATIGKCSIVGAWFGSFQSLMPFLGFCLASLFSKYIDKYDHWIAFVLLSLIGANMIKESFSKDDENTSGSSLSFRVMLLMAIATSIDALAVGVTFAFLMNFWKMVISVLMIGAVTFTLSCIGVRVGNIFGAKYKSKAELAGGIILILLGIKILLEGLGILNF